MSSDKLDLTPEELEKFLGTIVRWRYTSLRSFNDPDNWEEIIYLAYIDLERKAGQQPMRAELTLDKIHFDEVNCSSTWNEWHEGPLPDWMFAV